MKYDFSGWATKNDLKCTDGRTIKHGAFKANEGQTVPLVWQHLHNDPENILGHAVLENRPEGVYAYCAFNDTPKAQHAKSSVKHEDVKALSIYANQLVQNGGDVLHGMIREVSLVIAGANPGAFIDNIVVQHGDTETQLDSEAIIFTGLEISLEHSDEGEADTSSTEQSSDNTEGSSEVVEHAEDSTDNLEHTGSAGQGKGDTMAQAQATSGDKTVKDIFDSMTEEQKNVVYFMIGQALDGAAQHSDSDNEEDNLMHTNIFEQGSDTVEQTTLSHDQLQAIFTDAKKIGSFKEAFLAHAGTYGINNIDILFPDAQTLTSGPDFIKRRTEWVNDVLSNTKHSPFSRIKSVQADITADDARAKGYIKGNLKKEEFFGLMKRVTTPTTIYKKQKLDRDDIIDIVDLDVVAWLKAEMRLMLDEEIARAILIGDGRDIASDDKIKDPAAASDGAGVRSILHDDPVYAHPVSLAAGTTGDAYVDGILENRSAYKGAGTPTFYTTEAVITSMLLAKDTTGRRLYASLAELASTLRVKAIIPVEVMETVTNLVGIIVNLTDYTVGADKGGEVSMFDDFDIDYNQQKYLLETRISGALTQPKSALVITKAAV